MIVRVSLIALLFALPSIARADIYVWSDAQGVKHYTNRKALIPQDAGASVMVEEPAHAPDAGAPAAAPAAAEEPASRQAENAFDQGAMAAAAYAAGWQQGLASAQQMAAPAPVNVEISGPLAIATGGNGGSSAGGGYGYFPAWWAYNYPPLITTSFDNGRSRHLTLRMLLQDQFAIDREGPYFLVDRFPPLGPNLSTVLPRGLPFVGGGLGNRVLNH